MFSASVTDSSSVWFCGLIIPLLSEAECLHFSYKRTEAANLSLLACMFICATDVLLSLVRCVF